MKLIDALRNVQRPDGGRWDFLSPVEAICSDLGINSLWDYPDELDTRLKSYPVVDWLCTDTTVGLFAIYLDGVLVGMSFQSARKSDRTFKWVSQEAADHLRRVLLTYTSPEEIAVIDPEEDFEPIAKELAYLSGGLEPKLEAN